MRYKKTPLSESFGEFFFFAVTECKPRNRLELRLLNSGIGNRSRIRRQVESLRCLPLPLRRSQRYPCPSKSANRLLCRFWFLLGFLQGTLSIVFLTWSSFRYLVTNCDCSHLDSTTNRTDCTIEKHRSNVQQ